MTRIEWDKRGKRHYEVGVDCGVFYPNAGPGVPWNGLVSISELEDDAASGRIIYVDGNRHSTQLGLGSFAAKISAITYPEEFEPYDGYDADILSNQRRRAFHLSYRSKLGNDTKGEDYGYLIHLVYNALATPSSQDYRATSAVLDPTIFSWTISTTPVVVPEARASSHFIIDTTKAYPETIVAIEEMLYGTNLSDPRMPSVTEVLDLFEEYAIFKVIPHGDGTVTISGPDSAVYEIGTDLWRLEWPSVIEQNPTTYRLSSF